TIVRAKSSLAHKLLRALHAVGLRHGFERKGILVRIIRHPRGYERIGWVLTEPNNLPGDCLTVISEVQRFAHARIIKRLSCLVGNNIGDTEIGSDLHTIRQIFAHPAELIHRDASTTWTLDVEFAGTKAFQCRILIRDWKEIYAPYTDIL